MSLTTAPPRPEAEKAAPTTTAPRPNPSRMLLAIVMFALLGYSAWSVQAVGINIPTLISGYENAVEFLDRTWPFTLPPTAELVDMIGQTLAIVVLATLVGFILSVPLAYCAAENTTPHPAVRITARMVIVLERAVPTFIIAMFFVRALGLGALPGIIALGIGALGFMGKLFADAIEDVDPGPQEALRASGAGPVQQFVSGVLPQIKPQMIATSLHMFDINLRGSVLLGYVGVAGIGLWIASSLETMNYARGLGLTVVLLVLCLAAELVSMTIRRALLGVHKEQKASTWSRWTGTLMPQLPSRGWVMGRKPRDTGDDKPADTAQQTAAPGAAAKTTDGAVRVSPPWTGSRVASLASQALLLVAVVVSLWAADVKVGQLSDSLGNAFATLGLYWPPDDGGIMDKLLDAMVETIQMGLAGTFFGLMLAIPLGLCSANNVVRIPWLNTLSRVFVVTVRAIPDIIIGILFVVLTGLGSTAGALALAIGSIGFFSKVIADSLEEVDTRVQDAVRATGATAPQVFFASTLRQVLPALVAHTMHQMDRNLRGATALGIIGAGGIGFFLQNASRVLEYGVVTTSVMLIVVVVMASEAMSMWTRREVH